ncbi:MAG: methylmalonyl-CoA carboxyltransferase [Alphaproteobacteria bacterium]|nr:methylmalonyl-CoA carboxyltransferase [Alphaproteobacteria bacterium]
MPFEDVNKDLDERRAKVLKMGKPAILERMKNDGLLNARQRLDYLFDKGTFVESGMLATASRPEVREKAPADGKVAGYGKVDGRWVGSVSNDFSVMGASSALINLKKMKHIKDVANKRGMPLVWIGESSGSRMPDRMGAQGRVIIAQDPYEYRRMRDTPWITAQLGDCYGSSTWYACMSDFVVMRKGATMAVASSRVTSMAINQPVSNEELGGWKMHTSTSGLVDMAVDTDEEALDVCKNFLSYLPSHNMEAPPVHAVPAGSDTAIERITEIVPEARQKVYNMRHVVEVIADRDSLFEMKPRYGRSVLTTLARLNGQTVGFLASNPLYKGGAADPDGCCKAASFIVFCDSFNIPIIMLVDVPGFLIGVEGERKAAPGKIMNWMNALSLATVPKLSVIMRKSYGQAYINMAGNKGSDEMAMWPTADVGFMDPHTGVNVVFGLKQEDDPEEFARRVEELQRDAAPWELAAMYEAQDVIKPQETRQHLINMLEVHRMRLTNGVGEHLMRTWPTSIV